MSGIESSESLTAVGVNVTAASPVTRTLTNSDVDAAKIVITFPQIQEATDKGDLLGSTVDLKIQVQYNSGGFSDVLSELENWDGNNSCIMSYTVRTIFSLPLAIDFFA